MKKFSHKQWVWMGIIFIFIFIGIQFIRPPLENPPVTEIIQPSDSVHQTLIKSCYDCHTSMTRFSWFDKIAPASWIVADHIREGRKALNFSQWDSLTKTQQKVALFESLNQMEFKLMPLKQYLYLHPSAKISAAEIKSFKSWLGSMITPLEADSSKTNIWNEQYNKWIHETSNVKNIKPCLNGIAFMPGYKNWIAISSTERFDNGTMRVITGNDIAIQAIRANQINPWPDGAAIAKILWTQVLDSSGNINAGELKQIDFMIRGKDKYASTGGWGFARWVKGLQLEPYGKNELFASECINCHQTMKEFEFVFTMPVNLNPAIGLEGKVISSSINKSKGTMSTLYGNDIAAHFARTQTGNHYPKGSVLTLVTWMQREDEHWFGARIPGIIQTVESVHTGDLVKEAPKPAYEKYTGSALEKMNSKNSTDADIRMKYILNLRASVMP